jgi:uncharacterized protein (TIGR00255 family)
MRSMTGFGQGEAPLGEGQLIVEVRALNHRYLDIRIRLPPELNDHTFFLEQLARKALGRGRFDVAARLSGAAIAPPQISVERAKARYEALAKLRDELTPGEELSVTVLTTMPELFESPESRNPEGTRKAIEKAFSIASRRLTEMREGEGAALHAELTKRLGKMRYFHEQIEDMRDGWTNIHRRKLKVRLSRLLEDVQSELEPNRLETELAILADKSDITEELVRLESHFNQFKSLIDSDEAVGRKLDFLLQEVGREVNTIGAKCQDASVSHIIVEMKSEVERLREQVQNVE